MKEHKKVFFALVVLVLILAAAIGGDIVWNEFRTRPLPVLDETDVVLDTAVSQGLSSKSESDFSIPEEYDENQLLTRICQSEMVWIERIHNGESYQTGESELWVAVLLEDDGLMSIYLGESSFVHRGNALYEITDSKQLLEDVKGILTEENTILSGEGYQTYPIEITS